MAYQLELFYAWKNAFDGVDSVEVLDDDILKLSADAIVSPANSFGYMDGGLDLKYSEHFGWELEGRVRVRLENDYFGEIPVGSAIITRTNFEQVPLLITAPTMRVPSDVSSTVNAYLAFKAILQAIIAHNAQNKQQIETVLCPGLATGEGKMPPERCAKQMRRAYDVCINSEFVTRGGLAGAVTDHLDLLV